MRLARANACSRVSAMLRLGSTVIAVAIVLIGPVTFESLKYSQSAKYVSTHFNDIITAILLTESSNHPGKIN